MTDKLKVILDDLKNRLRVLESQIDLHTSQIEMTKSDIRKLDDKRDNTEHLKSNHKEFTESFNSTVKKIFVQLDSNKLDTKEQMTLQDEKREQMKNDLLTKLQELSIKVDTISKTLDF